MKQLRGKHAKKFIKSIPSRPYDIVAILENIQYAKNVANMFRTAEAAGVSKLYLTGISHTPPFGKGLKKVSRGSENKVKHEYCKDTTEVIPILKEKGYKIIAIELTDEHFLLEDLSIYIKDIKKICFIVGNEDSGVNRSTLELCDTAVTIPMYGKNISLNVNVSFGVVLFSFC
jgi:tRNA G18 (ribose-2'-O)-methylase SpoU